MREGIGAWIERMERATQNGRKIGDCIQRQSIAKDGDEMKDPSQRTFAEQFPAGRFAAAKRRRLAFGRP